MTVVLADLDGVLVDSYASIVRAWTWWAERHGLEGGVVETVRHGRPSGEIVRELAPALDAHAESLDLDARQASDTDGVIALPGAAALFAAFGSDRLAVVTSCTVPLATARLSAAGLPRPDVLVTPERVRAGKPDPEAYLLAARDLRAEPAECVVLEDAPAGVAAGRAAGMHVVGILTTHPAADLEDADETVPTVAAWLAAIGR